MQAAWALASAYWPAASVLVLAVVLAVPLFAGEKRPRPLGAGKKRHKPLGALLVFMGVIAVLAVSLVGSDPELGWSSFFGSLMEGFSALLGIYAAGTLVGYQIAAEDYDLKIGLALSALVIVWSSYAQGLGSCVSGVWAGLAFVAGFSALAFLGMALWHVVENLGPERIMAFPRGRLADRQDDDSWRLATVMGRYVAKGPGPWREALVGFRMTFLELVENAPAEKKTEVASSLLGPLGLVSFDRAGSPQSAAMSGHRTRTRDAPRGRV